MVFGSIISQKSAQAGVLCCLFFSWFGLVAMRPDNFPGIHQAALGKFEPAFDVFPPGRSMAILPQIAPDALFAAAQLDIIDCIEDGGIHRVNCPEGTRAGLVKDGGFYWDNKGRTKMGGL